MPRLKEIFESCYARYCECKEQGVSSINPASSTEKLNRPFRSSSAREFVADFDRCAEHALVEFRSDTPRIVYLVYFQDRTPYSEAVRWCQTNRVCKPGTFDYWYSTIKLLVGTELKRAGVWPMHRYFEERRRPRAEGGIVAGGSVVAG